MKYILASASPRRKELLEQAGLFSGHPFLSRRKDHKRRAFGNRHGTGFPEGT